MNNVTERSPRNLTSRSAPDHSMEHLLQSRCRNRARGSALLAFRAVGPANLDDPVSHRADPWITHTSQLEPKRGVRSTEMTCPVGIHPTSRRHLARTINGGVELGDGRLLPGSTLDQAQPGLAGLPRGEGQMAGYRLPRPAVRVPGSCRH
jgi:hypothetical protein